MVSSTLATLLLSSYAAFAAPIHLRRGLFDRFAPLIGKLTGASTTPVAVTPANIDVLGLRKAATVASAAYCPSVGAGTWDCATCGDVNDMQILFTAGDGQADPRLFVGFSAAMNAVVVSHEGTEHNLDAFLSDLDFGLADMDASLAPPAGAQVHHGFQADFRFFAQPVLDAVNSALAGVAKDATNVLVTGHSLGAADALLDGIHLRLALPETVKMQVVTFSPPRVGNAVFADYASQVLGDSLVHVINNNDIVPHLPPSVLGYQHPTTELWLNPDAALSLCPGFENGACSAGVDDLTLSVDPHSGPFFGIDIGSSSCTA